MFTDGETETKTSSTACLKSLCDSELMEHGYSCFQLPFGNHKGTTLSEVTKINSWGLLYSLTDGKNKVQV